jgi:hypothetical protein
VDLELTPAQPEPVVDAIESLVTPVLPTEPDPWWRAGLQESLET